MIVRRKTPAAAAVLIPLWTDRFGAAFVVARGRKKRGWDMVAVHRGAIHAARLIKPQIPLVGDDAIPIRHEIEFELRLDQPSQASP